LAVKFRRRYRWLVAGNVIVTVLPVAGLNVYPAEATTVVKVVPSLLPSTLNVCVRVAHDVDGGKVTTILLTLVDAPRSTCSHCGKALFALSQ
jgi:hypothetical protein